MKNQRLIGRTALFALCLSLSSCGSLVHKQVASIRLQGDDVAALSPGAEVGVVRHPTAQTRQFITGTVLQSGQSGVVLANCQSRTERASAAPLASKIPYIKRLYKNTGTPKELVPVIWVPTVEIESALVMTPPPADGHIPQLELDLSHGNVNEQVGIDYDFSIEDVSRSRE